MCGTNELFFLRRPIRRRLVELDVDYQVLPPRMYTLQEWTLLVRNYAPDLVVIAPLAFLTVAALLLELGRGRSDALQWKLVAATSVFWTYHGTYDFVLLLPHLITLIVGPTNCLQKMIGIRYLPFDSFGFWVYPVCHPGNAPLARVARWATRLILLGIVSREFVTSEAADSQKPEIFGEIGHGNTK